LLGGVGDPGSGRGREGEINSHRGGLRQVEWEGDGAWAVEPGRAQGVQGLREAGRKGVRGVGGRVG